MCKNSLRTGLFLAVVFVLFSSFLKAQKAAIESIRCGTYEWDMQRRAQNPKIGSTEDFEKWMQAELQHRRDNPDLFKTNATRVIPTVVHVIYSNAGENISTAMVQSQIDVLNEDFQRLNADTTNTPVGFRSVAANCDVEFCLAQIDPNGNPTTGIDRISMAGSPFSMATIDNTIKPATIWNPNNYFNLWVANIGGGLLGWAQFPEAGTLAGIGTGNGAANTDGVVILYASVGRPPANTFAGPYNLGRTATHEVGHWLGLRHIWGDGNCTVDDFCNDTPTSDASNFGCPTTHVSCTTTDMVQNYMDYTDDACMNIFTRDQKARIDVVLGGSIRRASLLTSGVCNLSPSISFVSGTATYTESSATGTIGCRGYTDISIPLRIGGPPTGAATVTMNVVSQTLTPNVDYQVIVGSVVFPNGVTGNQNFRLRLFDDASVEGAENIVLGFTISGPTDAYAAAPLQHTITLNDNDLGPGLAGSTTILSEDFESGAAGWTSLSGGGNNQWLVAGTNGGMTGARSAYVSRNGSANSYTVTSTSTSVLRSPLINATGLSGMQLSFDFKCNGETGYDFGYLAYSTNGTTFTPFDGTSSAPFVAQATPINYSVALPAILDNTSFYLGWIWTNDNSIGNNPPFTVDQINLTAQAPIQVENVLASTNTEYLGPFSTAYWYDNATGDIMLSINNNTAWDYGCTAVTIDRAGTTATPYISALNPYFVTSKTFTVTPANNNPSGAYTIRLYYRGNEISGWETATGQNRASITIAKTGGPISNITPATPLANGPTNYYGQNPITSAYNGTDFWVEADFATGFSGFAAGIEDPGSLAELFFNVKASWEGNDGILVWNIGGIENLREFQIERLDDNGSFRQIATMNGNGQNQNSGSYNFRDLNLAASGFAESRYRIRAQAFDGTVHYSQIVSLNAFGNGTISIFPNPFNQYLNLQVGLVNDGRIEVSVYNQLGQKVGEVSYAGRMGGNSIDIENLTGKANGIYYVKVKTSTSEITKKVLRSR